MNKKGSIVDMPLWIVVAFVTVFILAGFIFLFAQVGGKLAEIGVVQLGDNQLNITDISDSTFGQVNSVLPTWLHIIAYIIIIGGAISIFISNFLVKGNPIFLVVYIFMTIAAVILAAYLSNVYMDMLSNPLLGSTLSGFTASNYIMQYLPYFTAVIGIFGAIFLFIGIIRERESGVMI